MSVIIETTIGDLVVDLFVEERPRASLNFLKLCKVKFYNYSLFHFVQGNFLAQCGDPSGSGQGGESIFRSLYGDQARYFEAETKPRLKHVKKGTVSMVNNGNDMHGSQFFITLGEDLDYLDGQHTVFGEIAEGFDIIDKFNEAICDDQHRPYQDIRITHTVILDDPFDDPSALKIPDRSPEPTKEQLDSGRIGADEEVDDAKGKTIEEVQAMIDDRELKAGTQILEMVGDIPDAEVKPPENVLFVCKLNPVTTDEDLEIIFSRFGTVKSCETIKDALSQESLQYAFIEYENVEDCERAYFKMDNVLIDDRRIHVDFSQSVAKLVYNKPGSKPVYQLKEKQENKPKLKIKDSSRKEKYDLVFEDNDRKKHSKKDSQPRRSSSEESSPKIKRKRDKEGKKRDRNRQGNNDVDGQRSPNDRRDNLRTGDEQRFSEGDRKRGGGGEPRRDEGKHRSRKKEKTRTSDDEYDRGSSGKREDRDGYSRSKEERYAENHGDKSGHDGKHEDQKQGDYYREERDSKGRRRRDKREYKGIEDACERISEKRHRERQDPEERKGKHEKIREKRDRNSSSGSDDEYYKKKKKR